MAAGGPWEVGGGLEEEQEMEKPFPERKSSVKGMAGSRRQEPPLN